MFKKFKKHIIFLIICLISLSLFLFFRKNFTPIYIEDKKTFKHKEIQEITNFKNIETLNKNTNIILEKKNINEILNAMHIAKKYILNNDLDKSFIELKNCLNHIKEENLTNILKLRMAKIKIEKNEYEIALNILNSIKNKHWMNIVENIKGDIFLKKNKRKDAIKCWKKSLTMESSNASREIIKMKINEFQ